MYCSKDFVYSDWNAIFTKLTLNLKEGVQKCEDLCEDLAEKAGDYVQGLASSIELTTPSMALELLQKVVSTSNACLQVNLTLYDPHGYGLS